jgi:hypothetical protein
MWLGRIAALPGWRSPYDLLPGSAWCITFEAMTEVKIAPSMASADSCV